jgi:hypothetical protein
MADLLKFTQALPAQLYGAGSAIGDASITLVSFTDPSGNVLAMTDFGSKGYGTIEPGNGEQQESFTFTGLTVNGNGSTTLSGVKHILFKAPYTESTGLNLSHAGGVSVIISNTPAFYDALSGKSNDETISGIWTFTSPNYPRIDSTTTPPTLDVEFATKKYADDLAIAGAPKATETVYGISKLSTAAVSATDPIVVGNNDTRIPTQGENDALVGTSGTPSSTNKFVTNDDTSATSANAKLVRTNGSGKIVEGFLQTTDANMTLLTGGIDSDASSIHTHTLLSTGTQFMGTGGATAKTYHNFVYPFTKAQLWGTFQTAAAGWTFQQLSNGTALGWNCCYCSPSSTGGSGMITLGGIDYGQSYNKVFFDDNKKIITEFTLSMIVGATLTEGQFGIISDALAYVNFDDATFHSASFSYDTSGKLYGHTANAGGTTNHTETEITGITLSSKNLYRIEFNPGVNVKFYVNGVLKATNTTNLPSGAVEINWGFGSANAVNTNTYIAYVSAPYFAVQN